MSSLLSAMNANSTTTENGMPTLERSLDAVVDLFFKWGGSRGNYKALRPLIFSAAAEDLNLTLSLLLWGRDIRGGAGERDLFKEAIHDLSDRLTPSFIKKIPEVGRWDDLLCLLGTKWNDFVLDMIDVALTSDQNGLCAKWMPRENKNPIYAKAIYDYMGISPRAYRKMLVRLTNVVETKMCANQWKDIEYGHVPSVAAARYQAAFSRHDTEGYAKYRDGLVKGTEKINASAVYPYNVIQSIYRGVVDVAEAQWKALPDYLEGDTSNTLVVADVSGSMSVPAGNNPNVTCIDVCLSLALYLSERNKGLFHNAFITFSSKPKLQILKGSLYDRMNQLRHSNWEMTTNLEAVFNLILGSAVKGRVTPDQMPNQVVILSDMQFDQCTRSPSDKAFDMIQRQYEEAGYKMPRIVFWNLRSSNGIPVTFDTQGTALVSGFSPSLMKAVLKKDVADFTPRSVMLAAIGVDRYKH
jgi:Domain of unknown function (DUF2828)